MAYLQGSILRSTTQDNRWCDIASGCNELPLTKKPTWLLNHLSTKGNEPGKLLAARDQQLIH
jgi:hypothetical protein